MSELKTYAVPLAHDTLTKDEVAARCIAAANAKGYVPAPDPFFSYEEAKKWTCAASHFVSYRIRKYMFHNHDNQRASPNTLATLEAFEKYCYGRIDEGLEQRIANLEDAVKRLSAFVGQLADILAEKLQEPKEEAKADERVRVEELFAFSGKMTILCLPDDSMLWLPPDGSTWCKAGNHMDISPHTLINVEKHTVGKFYLFREGDPNKFSDYALCLDNGKFAYAYNVVGTIAVAVIQKSDNITLQEVQPLNQ